MGGLPCIRSLRIPVATVVGMVGEGMAETEILNAYPDLEIEDPQATTRFISATITCRKRPILKFSHVPQKRIEF
jgi:uncharacterized protein (DUF433 family)